MTDTMKRRIDKLQRRQERRGATVPGDDWYSLRVSPSCPPDKRLHLRGGRGYYGYYSRFWDTPPYHYRVYTVPALIADLADPTSVTEEVTFTNAGWYQFFMLLLKLPAILEQPTAADWSFWLWGTGDEQETAAEAEAWMISVAFRQSSPWSGGDVGKYHGYPLCGLVLKNDGQTGIPGAFLPVDVVNRDRSYQWPTDVRPRQYVDR